MDRKGYELQHRQVIARRHLEVIPKGARVAYVDAAVKPPVARCAVIIAEGWPDVEVVTELVINPGTVDVNEAELAAIIAAAAFNPDYIVSDSWAAIDGLEGGMYEGIPVVFVPGKTGVVLGHDRAHDLATAARKEAEEG